VSRKGVRVSLDEPPSYKLYAPWNAGFAVFLGNALAGSIVLAINYWRLGRRESAVQSIIIGLGISVLTLAIPLSLPKFRDIAPVLLFLQGVASLFLAQELQGEAFANHLENGGTKVSLWWVLAMTLLSFLVLFVVVVICWGIRCLVMKS
jgi:hypothetical protein